MKVFGRLTKKEQRREMSRLSVEERLDILEGKIHELIEINTALRLSQKLMAGPLPVPKSNDFYPSKRFWQVPQNLIHLMDESLDTFYALRSAILDGIENGMNWKLPKKATRGTVIKYFFIENAMTKEDVADLLNRVRLGHLLSEPWVSWSKN